jgi:hypothetical protein
VADYLAIVGDRSDNIRGVDGIGPVGATKLLGEFGSLDGILSALNHETDKFPPVVFKKLCSSLGQLEMAQRLVTLCRAVPLAGVGADRLLNWIGGGKNSASVAPVDGHGGVRSEDDDPRARGPVAETPRTSSAAVGSPHAAVRTAPPGRGAEEPGTSSRPVVKPGLLDSQYALAQQQLTQQALAHQWALSSSRPSTPEVSPMMSPSIDQLATALAKAQSEMENAKKDSVNPHFRAAYADLASIWDAARAVLGKHGLAVVQTIRAENGESVLTTRLMHASGQWIASELPILAAAKKPQEFGSALTYARRYALAAIVGVASDDDDGEAAAGRPFAAGQQRARA